MAKITNIHDKRKSVPSPMALVNPVKLDAAADSKHLRKVLGICLLAIMVCVCALGVMHLKQTSSVTILKEPHTQFDSSKNPSYEESVARVEQLEREQVQVEPERRGGNISSLIRDTTFSNVISLALGIFAFMGWINYFSGFTPDRALTDIVRPAIFTFLAFKWSMILMWVHL